VFDGAGVQTHRYLYGTRVDQVLADETPTQMLWALADNQGTVKDLIDNAGNAVSHINYDSFGRVVSQTGNVEFRYGYTGREQDAETGLDYYRARYYDVGVGRFISEDPVGFGAGDTNIYRYVGNSPTNYNDPSGNFGNNVNPSTGKNPNDCIALAEKKKPPLDKNKKCTEGVISVPLTKGRLEEIGRYVGVPRLSAKKRKEIPLNTPQAKIDEREEAAFQSNLGQAFEYNVLQLLKLGTVNQDYEQYNQGNIESPRRKFETTLHRKKTIGSIKPDILGSQVLTNKAGVIVKTYPRSDIIEVKATSDKIGYDYNDYQVAGLLEYAGNSPVAQDGLPPRLTFITTETSIRRSLILDAIREKIALYHIIVKEDCIVPGHIILGDLKPLNEPIAQIGTKVLKGVNFTPSKIQGGSIFFQKKPGQE
jgi:RHS repeat-associated protein